MPLRDTLDDEFYRGADMDVSKSDMEEDFYSSPDTLRSLVTGSPETMFVNESTDFDSWLLRGDAFASMGRLNDAEESFVEALKMDPESQKTLYKLTDLMVKKGDNVRALFFIDRLLDSMGEPDNMDDRDPAYLLTWVNKGNILARMKRSEDSLKCYDWVLEIDDQYEHAWFNKTLVLFELKRHMEALKAVDRVLDISRKNYDALNLKGLILYSLAKKREESESVKMMELSLLIFNRITLAKPEHVNALNNKCMVLVELGRYEMALPELRIALKEDEKHPILLFCMARAYGGLGNSEKSKEFLKKALKQMPELGYKAQITRQFSFMRKDPEFMEMLQSYSGKAVAEWKEGEVKALDRRR